MRLRAGAVAAALLGAAFAASAQEGARDPLAAGFADPPPDARPLVFSQWVNGNVTQEGIRLDLEWMQRTGLAGAILFDIGFRSPPVPQYVAQRVGFGSPEWERAVGFAAAEARRLGLSLGAQSSGGWSVSGDPSVAPESAMKKLVWSETLLTPRSPPTVKLPPLPAVNGPFQDLPIGNPAHREPTRVGEVAVIAFRLPEAEQRRRKPVLIRNGAGQLVADAHVLSDGSYARGLTFTPDANGEVLLQVRTRTAPAALTLAMPTHQPLPDGSVEASTNGRIFTQVAAFPVPVLQPMPATTLALRDRGETHWRIRFRGLESALELAELNFQTGARVERWQAKAGFGVVQPGSPGNDSPAAARVVDPRHIIDLTSRMSADGSLNWRPDRGAWQVMRFGWSLTGRRTVPATAESIGLEVDKLDAGAVRAFAENFYARYSRAVGTQGALDIAFTDSWEAGQQNWTPAMLERFQERRGYDLRPWLPVLAGRVVGSVQDSERLLADFRRTLSELITVNHYGVIAEVARRHGMSYYAQAPGVNDPMPVDALLAKGQVDVPTGEFWVWPEDGEPDPRHLGDVRDAASAAHIHGKRLVAVESLTTQGEQPWAQGPAQWRRMMDRVFVEGMNRVILHTSAHQPFTDRRPGMTLRQYGQHFTRNETWAEDAAEWVRYLARTSFLLQQGRPVADLLVFQGEDVPLVHSTVTSDRPPRERMRPEGFDLDFIHADLLIRELQVKDGLLTLPGGNRYRALEIAPGVRSISLPAMRKLRQLVDDGAVLIGFWRLDALGIADLQAEVTALAAGLQASAGGPPPHAPRRGRLYVSWDQARDAEQWVADVAADGAHALRWNHRATGDADLYFISNQSARGFSGAVRFRVQRHAELWDAVTGTRTPANYSADGHLTQVQLDLEPWSSTFVVFRGSPRPAPPPAQARRVPLLALDEGWSVRFLDIGPPREPQNLASGSWTRHANPDIRYYSGRASYSRRFQVPASRLSGGHRVELDLGGIGDLARVRVNGRDLGTWWSAPFRRDITAALRPGENRLEITVTNYWANRLIGDAQPGVTGTTFTPIRPYAADAPLRPAGLLGPVQLISLVPGRSP
jgi:hypothetical protein